ncbi:MAG: type II toxin-antitoxin system HipA family toxin [Eubacteriales bacterium]|nr:type II toxin-antitoxin system HipA family toxin [Eubacteriales bacterium]
MCRVCYRGRLVGTLAETASGFTAFQYDGDWLRNGFSISPLSLPLENRVFLPKSDVLEGLFGVFSDSLPDGWGRFLVDRMLRSQKIAPSSVRPLARLCIVGKSGMGGLEYIPEILPASEPSYQNFDHLNHECQKLLQEQDSPDFDTLLQLGGSSGGARPKILVTMDQSAWIVKFPASHDRLSIGDEEYRYMTCAARCGIQIPPVKLLSSSLCSGFFAVRRFDRTPQGKVHMITASGLLETSHRIPNLDYHDLMKLTYLLTRDMRQTEELYRRMCFNVFAHNRDDHSKNFSFLYDDAAQCWTLSPAYDLTYSSSIGGEHASCVDGNGRNPSFPELLAVGERAGIPHRKALSVAKNIQAIVEEDLGEIKSSYESPISPSWTSPC